MQLRDQLYAPTVRLLLPSVLTPTHLALGQRLALVVTLPLHQCPCLNTYPAGLTTAQLLAPRPGRHVTRYTRASASTLISLATSLPSSCLPGILTFAFRTALLLSQSTMIGLLKHSDSPFQCCPPVPTALLRAQGGTFTLSICITPMTIFWLLEQPSLHWSSPPCTTQEPASPHAYKGSRSFPPAAGAPLHASLGSLPPLVQHCTGASLHAPGSQFVECSGSEHYWQIGWIPRGIDRRLPGPMRRGTMPRHGPWVSKGSHGPWLLSWIRSVVRVQFLKAAAMTKHTLF